MVCRQPARVVVTTGKPSSLEQHFEHGAPREAEVLEAVALDSSGEAAGYSCREDLQAIATRGPLTPDHTLHTRRIPAIFSADDPASLDRFADEKRGVISAPLKAAYNLRRSYVK